MPLQGTTYNWGYKTEFTEPHMNNRIMDCGRGKGLGGSSLINGMCYIRGNALDFDHWRKPGRKLDISRLPDPILKKAENRDAGANTYHGAGGPIDVATAKPGTNPLFEAMIQAGVDAGYPRTVRLNGYQQEGFGPMDRFVTPEGPPRLHRPRLS